MRVYKYFYFVILTLFCSIITTGHFLAIVANDCGSVPFVRFQFSKENSESVFDEITELKSKYDVGVYIPDIYNENKSEIRCVYYADDKSRQFLENDRIIHEGKYRDGLFSGRYMYNIEYRKLEEACGEIGFLHSITLVGESDAVKSFADDFCEYIKQCYEDKYSCNSEIGSNPSRGSFFAFILITWIIADAIMLVIIVFETSVVRKEAMVALMNGSSLAAFISKRMAADISVYCVILVLLSTFLSKLGTPMISYLFCWGNLIVIIVTSLLSYLTLYISNIKATLGGVRQGIRILYFNYFIKLVTVTAAMILFVELIAVIDDNRGNSDTQATIDKYFNGYSYTNIIDAYQSAGKLDQDDPKEIMYKIYSEHYDDLKPIQLSCSVDEDGFSYVSANKFAVEYLSSVMPELRTADLSKEFILLCRKGDTLSETKIKESEAEIIQQYGVRPQIVYYERSVRIMGLDQDTNTRIDYVSDPCIQITNCDAGFLLEHGYRYGDYDALLLDDEKIKMICDEYGINERDLAVCGVGQTFESQWGVGKASIISQAAIEGVILLIVLLISMSVFKFTFIAKAKELCIKKICGHGLFSRYLKTYLVSLAVYIPAYGYARYSSYREHVGKITVFTLVMIVIDLLITIPYIIKTERTNVSKVLKGGAL